VLRASGQNGAVLARTAIVLNTTFVLNSLGADRRAKTLFVSQHNTAADSAGSLRSSTTTTSPAETAACPRARSFVAPRAGVVQW
jgi:hypothetical protein